MVYLKRGKKEQKFQRKKAAAVAEQNRVPKKDQEKVNKGSEDFRVASTIKSQMSR